MDNDTVDDRLYSDPDLAQFYDLDNGWGADLDYCLSLAQDTQSVLDLGCGTGLLMSRLAGRSMVVGVDPAVAMLEIARCRSGSDQITWVEADARELRLDKQFDLIVLTGHTFQVFLSEDDQRAVISTIVKHLAHGGRFVFDSRNPVAEEWHSWKPEQTKRAFLHPRLGKIEAWNDATHDATTGVVTYQTHYQIASSQQCLSAESKIMFTPQKGLAGLLDEAGLAVDTWLGDWYGNDYNIASPDIIPVGHLR